MKEYRKNGTLQYTLRLDLESMDALVNIDHFLRLSNPSVSLDSIQRLIRYVISEYNRIISCTTHEEYIQLFKKFYESKSTFVKVFPDSLDIQQMREATALPQKIYEKRNRRLKND